MSDTETIEGVRRAILQYGWSDLTMEQLAGELGVSRMTLHRRGLTRAVIVGLLRARLAHEEREALWPALVAGGNGRERLELALRGQCAVAERNLALAEALAGDARDTIYHDEGDGALTRSEFTDPLRRLLLDGAGDGSLARQNDPDEVATVLYNLVGWTYHHLRVGHRWTAGRAEDAVVRIALDGVAA